MKITKVYYRDNNPHRYYFKKVEGSKLIGFVGTNEQHFTVTNEQHYTIKEFINNPKFNTEKVNNLKYASSTISDNSYQYFFFTNTRANEEDIESITNYAIKIANNINAREDYLDYKQYLYQLIDLLLGLNHLPLNEVAYCINNKEYQFVPHSYHNAYTNTSFTIFYSRAHSSMYSDGDSIEGELVSNLRMEDATTCEHCQEYCDLTTDHMSLIESSYYVCEDCYSNSYGYCESCDYTTHYDNLYYCEDRGAHYCSECNDEHIENHSNRNIHNYSYKPMFSFYDTKGNKIVAVDKNISKVPFYGCELEVEVKGGSKGDYATEITDYSENDILYCKEDGSLSNGFEICTHPMTYNAIKSFNFYEAIFKHRGTDKLQSYNTSTCGMHVHISKSSFSDHHLIKFISFIHEYKSLIYLISQRKKVSELNSWSRFNNSFKDKAKKEIVGRLRAMKQDDYYNGIIDDKAYKSYIVFGDKYVPVNLQHKYSVEVRIFKGNLLELSFRKNIEFIDSLFYFTKNNPLYRLKLPSYIDYCRSERKHYPNLNKYLDTNINKLDRVIRFPLEIPEGLDF